MDALAVFADPDNWVDYDDDDCPPCFTFQCNKIDDPIQFAHDVIDSLRKKAP